MLRAGLWTILAWTGAVEAAVRQMALAGKPVEIPCAAMNVHWSRMVDGTETALHASGKYRVIQ